ncbi:exodeoxyribonuclease I [Candidatus Saccharibacteria bacterium]|nr:exodeoxyribonuclease I [Candidatus Saccharibacteria bacterium]
MKTFFFYDLETSGIDSRRDQIMQFAGQRTSLEMEPIGDPVNFYVKMNKERLPSVGACLITGISPQETLPDGLTEQEACQYLMSDVFTQDTIAVGFNNVRFDNEFLRHMFFRNFYDPYEWGWKDGRETWDILDLVRMVRALRPDGIEWGFNEDGRATNRLVVLAELNGVVHEKAHDALSDVGATIAVAKLLLEKQPKLFEWLLSMRDKKTIQKMVGEMKPIVYTSGKYDEKFDKTTVVLPIHVSAREAVVWDLRYSPEEFLKMSDDELRDLIFTWNNEGVYEKYKKGEIQKVPVKALKFNKCPAIAPLGVLEKEDGWEKIGLTKETVAANEKILKENGVFIKRILKIFADRPEYKDNSGEEAVRLPEIAEEKLYEAFGDNNDRINSEITQMADKALAAKWAGDTESAPRFLDSRLNEILPRYLARNFYAKLPQKAQDEYDAWRRPRIEIMKPGFDKDLMSAMTDNADEADEKKQKREAFVLENLRLWLDDVLS